MTYALAGRVFASKQAIIEEVQRIVAGGTITRDDAALLVDLLHRHPDAERKIGAGIARFYITDNEWGRKAIRLSRVDGSDEDFSWRKCIDNPSRKSVLHSALRNEVEGQIKLFKLSAFRSSDIILCPILNIEMRWGSSHVDHVAPDTFDVLATSFLEGAEPELTGKEKKRLADREIARRWQLYHACHAKLRVISARANLSVVKK